MNQFRWGIFGTGAISMKFAVGLSAAQDAVPTFVASRSLAKAQRFARALNIEHAFEGYASALKACRVDAVYIATPPSEHAAHAMLCIDAGIPVLVEKPFAASESDVIRVCEAAHDRGVFAMEGLWTRFLPAAQALRDQVERAGIGEVRHIVGNFGTSQVPDQASGMFDPTLGGGALSHLGAYPLSLAQWLFGTPEVAAAMGNIGPSGVDEDAAMLLRYPQGTIGSFFVSLRSWAPDDFLVTGARGMLAFKGSIVRPYGLRLREDTPRHAEKPRLDWRGRLRQHALVHRVAQYASKSGRGRGQSLNYHYAGNGYHYEADEVRSCVRKGALESPTMPLRDSIAVASTTERVRTLIHRQVNPRGSAS